MEAFQTQAFGIADLIQMALTPIFLISAIGVPLNVITNPLARIVDRARDVEDRICKQDPGGSLEELQDVMRVMARRARHMNRAITVITVSALMIALVVMSLFLNAFLHWDLSAFISIMFIASMLTLAYALLELLIEVRIATDLGRPTSGLP